MPAPPKKPSNTMPSAEAAALRTRRVYRPWRFVFALYALAMMVGIHWPRLQVGVGDVPGPDKMLHFLAFGGLTFFLWATGWISRIWLLWLVMMVWTHLAEWSQAIPILGRSFSWWDIVAGWLGVTSVTLWLWAFAPVGGIHNRLRQRFSAFLVQHVFARPRSWRNWFIVGGAGFVVSTILGVCAAMITLTLDPTRPRLAMSAGMLGWLLGGLAGVFGSLDALVRRMREPVADERPCFACGDSCTEAFVDERGYGSCDRCGASFHLGQWMMQLDLPRGTIARNLLFPAWIVLMLVLPVMLVMWYGYVQPDSFLDRVHPDICVPAAIATLSAALAFATRAFRRDMAVSIDAQSKRCRRCGHDVHATPVERGIGRCGECGTVFVRL